MTFKNVPLEFNHSPEGLKWLSKAWSAYTRTSLSQKDVLHMLKMAEHAHAQKSNKTETTVNHVVLNRNGKPYKLDDEVIVVKKGHERYNQIGEVWKIRNYNNDPKVSVCFDGDVCGFDPEEIDLY